MNEIGVNRKLWVFAVIIPVAIYLGWLLADPLSFNAMAFVGLLLGLLLIPLLLRWHRPVLVFAMNSCFTLFFLPGNPPLWLVMAFGSLTFIILESILNKSIRLQNVKSVTWALFIFTVIVLITVYARGGIGLKAFGAEQFGGRKYVMILGGVLVYFALSCRPILAENAKRWAAMFFLGTITFAVSDLIYMAGPAFYFLFMIFPVDFAIAQATGDIDPTGLKRFAGIGFAAIGPYYFMMARYGIRGIFSASHPWRFVLWCVIIGIALLGGFRSLLLLFAVIFLLHLWYERLFFTRFFFTLLLLGALAGTASLPFIHRMPTAIQRTVTFLPVDIDPAVRLDAEASSGWRLLMWKQMLPDLGQYLWLGRGYAINPTEMYMVQENQRRGFMESYDAAIIAGDYHSGPLSLMFNFGIPGTLAFIAFGLASIRVMHRNLRYGEDPLRGINTLLFSCFLTKFVLFWIIFGDIASDLPVFSGLVGFSVALNGGMREKPRQVAALVPTGAAAGPSIMAPLPSGMGTR